VPRDALPASPVPASPSVDPSLHAAAPSALGVERARPALAGEPPGAALASDSARPSPAPPRPVADPPRFPAPLRVTSPVASAAARAPSEPAAEPARSGAPPPAASDRPPALSTSSSTSATRAPAPPLARLSITAAPPAEVRIDRRSLGVTPLLGVPVEPGSHRVVFVSAALGERLETTIHLDPAGAQSLHADFTSATPQVYLR